MCCSPWGHRVGHNATTEQQQRGSSIPVSVCMFLCLFTGRESLRRDTRGPCSARAWYPCLAGSGALRHVGSQFPDVRWNPHPLRWKADSYLLDHQGSPGWGEGLFSKAQPRRVLSFLRGSGQEGPQALVLTLCPQVPLS